MKYEISVAIIFKNEIRCLERCLRSLAPLRERFSCQVVMADTGSDDGSRAVAERYADEVFDFPWVSDFAAARNAVIERCRGRWILVMDCDEWLDPEIGELGRFLRAAPRKTDGALITVRNYTTPEFDQYTDMLAFRLLRRMPELRYAGAIHESPVFSGKKGEIASLEKTILHHDGYVMLNDGSEAGKAKVRRNITLLREELRKTPDDLRRISEYADIAGGEPDIGDWLRRGVGLIQSRSRGWQESGPRLFSLAVEYAARDEMPEREDWERSMREIFPKSYFTRIDLNYQQMSNAYTAEDYDAALYYGEEFLRAKEDFRTDKQGQLELRKGPLRRGYETSERHIRLFMADCYMLKGEYDRVLPLLESTDWTRLDASDVKGVLTMLRKFQRGSGADTGMVLSRLWAAICEPVPSEAKAEERKRAFQEYCDVTPADEGEVALPAQLRELLALAEKIRALLARYPADDPMIVEFKNSDSYRKVAALVEGGIA